MATSDFPPPPRSTANPAPPRPSHSLRRTSSIDVAWPEGPTAPRRMVGRARDFRTDTGGQGVVLAQGTFRLRMLEDKTIAEISSDPPRPGIATLVGERGGGHLRTVLRERMPDLIARNDPLYLVLDDISGTALVSAFAWSQWYPDFAEQMRARMASSDMENALQQRANICWGLQEGNTGLWPDGPPYSVADADAGDLVNAADPAGWHPFHDEEGPGFRRARRIDVVRDDEAGLLRIDSMFQDSAKLKEGGRVAIHEYLLRTTCDLATLEILTLEPEARILPFSECPGAMRNVGRLIGKRLDAIRSEVLALLRGPEGCTHLNDALRALADVPALAEGLREPA
jgi:hypothetical protein